MTPRLFDRALHSQRLARAAGRRAQADFLRRRVAEDLADRLACVNRDFPLAVELGRRDGALATALAETGVAGKIGRLIGSDVERSTGGGADVVMDEERLAIGEAAVDLIVSTLGLHWVNDVVGALIQMRRALRPDGLFLGALLGGATLTELRQCLLAAETELRGGAGPRVSPFLDAHDGAGLMQRAGFALPVVDVDTLIVRYAHPLELMADLRAMGETNALLERPPEPLTRAILDRVAELYAERFAGPDGRIIATFEIITLTGWAPHPEQQKPLRPGSAKMRLADALGVVEQGAGEAAG